MRQWGPAPLDDSAEGFTGYQLGERTGVVFSPNRNIRPVTVWGLDHIKSNDYPEFRVPAELLERTPITDIPESIRESEAKKRAWTCLLAMFMPQQGVDELLETAVGCWNFYTDAPPPPAPLTARSVGKATIVASTTRPGLIISE